MHINNISQKAAAFILHKPFHPGSYKSLEQVWLAERKHEDAERKQKQLLEQRAQQSKIDELRRALHKSQKVNSEALQWVASQGLDETGLPAHLAREVTEHKLDWMYVNQSAAVKPLDPASILECKDSARDTLPKESASDTQKIRDGAIAGGRFDSGPASIINEADMKRKIVEDPIFLVKKAERAYQKMLAENPILVEKRKRDILAQEEADGEGVNAQANDYDADLEQGSYRKRRRQERNYRADTDADDRRVVSHHDNGDRIGSKHRRHLQVHQKAYAGDDSGTEYDRDRNVRHRQEGQDRAHCRSERGFRHRDDCSDDDASRWKYASDYRQNDRVSRDRRGPRNRVPHGRPLRRDSSSSASSIEEEPGTMKAQIGPVKPEDWKEEVFLGPPPGMQESIQKRLEGKKRLKEETPEDKSMSDLEQMRHAAEDGRRVRQMKLDRLREIERSEYLHDEIERERDAGLVPKMVRDMQSMALDKYVASRHHDSTRRLPREE